ncbi:hypothetical protein A3860_36930 [Niastella vici]|uniref:Uncharacterized protein n=1 Tax=Niastella vici TaxID=1703345 RepID=A0A1V9FML3_9BACT|nr:hypothetical protein [Niastella vici]OQP59578.1 hypothetical protein A3860_36930 [Niastella vici]
MGFESYLLQVNFKNPVPQTEIKDIIESAGASFLAGKSNTESIDTHREFYFEIRSALGLTEICVLLTPGERNVKYFTLRFSILSPSSVIDQSFAFLNKLNSLRIIKVLDTDNKLKKLDLSADKFKLNKVRIRKRQIIINNKTGLVIEGGGVSTEYIYNNNLMEKLWRIPTKKISPVRWLQILLFILTLIFGSLVIYGETRTITQKTIFFDFIDYVPLTILCLIAATQLIRLILFYRTNAGRMILLSLAIAAICLGYIVWHLKHVEKLDNSPTLFTASNSQIGSDGGSRLYFKENGYLKAERSDHWCFTTYRGSYTIVKDTFDLDIRLDFKLGKRAILDNGVLKFIDDTLIFEITRP